MATSLRPYLTSIRHTLDAALCLQTFPCQQVERHNKPEVEIQDNPELLLKPILIHRNEKEKCLIEGAINSVRISFRLYEADQLEEVLTKMYLRFLMQRAEPLDILRRKPVEGFSISFLITDEHCLRLPKQQIIDFVCDFIQEVDAEVGQFKREVGERARVVAAEFFGRLAPTELQQATDMQQE